MSKKLEPQKQVAEPQPEQATPPTQAERLKDRMVRVVNASTRRIIDETSGKPVVYQPGEEFTVSERVAASKYLGVVRVVGSAE